MGAKLGRVASSGSSRSDNVFRSVPGLPGFLPAWRRLGAFAGLEVRVDDSGDFGDAPGLGEAASRCVWGVAVEDLGDRADARFADVRAQGRQPEPHGAPGILAAAED